MKVKMLRSLGRAKADVAAGKGERREGQTYDVSDKEGKALVKQGLAVEVSASTPTPALVPAPVTSGKK